MGKLCENCIHCHKPISVKDYFDNTLKMPDIHKWGVDVFKHEFWLCNSKDVSTLVHTNGSMIMENCIKHNLAGNCESYLEPNAEDIVPSSIEILSTEELPEKIKTGREVELKAIITPAIIPAKTERKTITVPVTDKEGNPLYNSNNDPILEEKEADVIIVPEHENSQDITYEFQWYKNGRKLYKETKETLSVDTSSAGTAEFTCKVYQYINDNKDGGKKSAYATSNVITLQIVEPTVNTVVFEFTTGSVPISIPLPFTPNEYTYPITSDDLPYLEDWQLEVTESSEDLVVEYTEKLSLDFSDYITAELTEQSINITPSAENKEATLTVSWEVI